MSEVVPGYLAFQKIEKAAKEVRRKNPNLTPEQAIAKVYETRPSLVSRYREDIRKGRI